MTIDLVVESRIGVSLVRLAAARYRVLKGLLGGLDLFELSRTDMRQSLGGGLDLEQNPDRLHLANDSQVGQRDPVSAICDVAHHAARSEFTECAADIETFG